MKNVIQQASKKAKTLAVYVLGDEPSKFETGKEFKVKPNESIAFHAHANLRVTLESELELELQPPSRNFWLEGFDELVFCKENLLSKKGSIYVFQTNYLKSSEKALGLDDIKIIPEDVKENNLRKPYTELASIASDLKGSKKGCLEVLEELYRFSRYNIHGEDTSGKTIKQILAEYKKYGKYYGNCKEASLLCSSLCDCIGIPSRLVNGKYGLSLGGHEWLEACLPYNNSYAWAPVDPAMGYFCNYSKDHIIFSETPDYKSYSQKLFDKLFCKNKDISMIVEHV